MDLGGKQVAIVGAGYAGKQRFYRHLRQLGARLVVVDEPGHWSEGLLADGTVDAWLPVPEVGDPDVDAQSVLDALGAAGIRPDGVMTFWENSVSIASRVATALGLPANPPAAVDAARSKLRTRELLAELGLPGVRARRVRTLEELAEAAADIGYPAVVKPEFGASAMGVIRVDGPESLPRAYGLVREVVKPEYDGIFRAGRDLLVEEYLDGVEFDVDLVMHDGECVFSSVSQNWPTAEPSFQETGLHCPPDHDPDEVRELVELVVKTAAAFGLRLGVLHIEAKFTSRGPRVIELNARMGGGRVFEMVRSVWGVDLVEAHTRAFLGLPPNLRPSAVPLAASLGKLVLAPASGVLADLPISLTPPADCEALFVDVETEVGARVDGPEQVFASVLADVTVTARDLTTARSVIGQVVGGPPLVLPH